VSEVLAKAAILAELGEADRERLAELLEERTYQDGFLLFQQGQESSELLFIVEGQVELKKGGEEIARLGPGDSLGGVSLALIGKRECEAAAAGRVEVLALTRESYLRLSADYPGVALRLQESIVREVSACLREILDELSG
jgi:CRP-like cAMP-binding protein